MEERDDIEDSEFDEEQDSEEEEEGLDPNNPDDYFTIIEQEFNRTLILLEQSPECAQYASDYTKLFEAFYQSFSKQRELEGVTQEQQEDIETKNEKLDMAMTLAEEDKKTIDDLKDQIQHAWRLADEAHAREQLAQEIIDNLRRQVENLNKEIEFNRKMMTQGSDEDIEMNKDKDGLERERDRLVNEVHQLSTKLENAISYQEELERKNSAADMTMNEISGQLEDTQGEVIRQKKAKEKLEADIVDLNTKIEDKDKTVEDLNGIIDIQAKQMLQSEQEIKDFKVMYERVAKDLELITLKNTKLQDEHNHVVFDRDRFKKNLSEKTLDFKILSDETHKLKLENSKLMKIRDILEKQRLAVMHEKDEISMERNNIRLKIATLEKQIEDSKKFFDEDKRIIDALTKEKDLLNKTLQKQQGIQKDLNKLIEVQEQSKKKLELELDTIFAETSRQKKMISQLEKERDRLAEEQLDLTRTIDEHVEEIRAKKAFISDLKKTMTDTENQVRQQHNLYETMRSERNALQKYLQESNAECDELRKKLKIILHQTEQLKEDISSKEKLLIKDETIMRKITKEKENLKIELMTCMDNVRLLRIDVKELKDEEKRLHKTILNNEKTIRDQAKDLAQLLNERDILGAQLVRRNDEIALLNEKIRILQSTLARGETQYDQRLYDIKLLKLEVKRLRQEKTLIANNMANMVDLRQEILHLERDLTKSRMKCKALEQEAQHPLNIHRWRKLEGSDPELMELLQKLQIQQKRLLHQAAEAVERERHLKEAQRLYLNLRGVLAKQPGPGIQEQLLKTQRALKLRGDKLKSLVSELNMAELKSSEYKSDLQKVTDELAELKRKYLEEKKANRMQRMTQTATQELNRSSQNHSDARESSRNIKFTGGGFRMSVPQQITTK